MIVLMQKKYEIFQNKHGPFSYLKGENKKIKQNS